LGEYFVDECEQQQQRQQQLNKQWDSNNNSKTNKQTILVGSPESRLADSQRTNNK